MWDTYGRVIFWNINHQFPSHTLSLPITCLESAGLTATISRDHYCILRNTKKRNGQCSSWDFQINFWRYNFERKHFWIAIAWDFRLIRIEVLDLKVGIEECLSDYNTTAESQLIVPALELDKVLSNGDKGNFYGKERDVISLGREHQDISQSMGFSSNISTNREITLKFGEILKVRGQVLIHPVISEWYKSYEFPDKTEIWHWQLVEIDSALLLGYDKMIQ